MKKLNVYNILFDGIDRSGKTTLRYYLGKMSNHMLTTYDRGIVSNIGWNKMLNREVEYDLEQWKSTVFVHLKVDEDDWEIRCKLTNEQPIDYEKHIKLYEDAFQYLKDRGFYVLEFNTTKMTHYQISKKILRYVNELNGKGNEL